MQIDGFADFYHREQQALVRFAATIVGPDRADDVVADAEHHERISSDLAAALARLSPRQRAVIHLAYWEDLRPPDIAARLTISEGSVRRHLARARRNLRAALQSTATGSDHDAQSLIGGTR